MNSEAGLCKRDSVRTLIRDTASRKTPWFYVKRLMGESESTRPPNLLSSDTYRILSWNMAASVKDYISQPPLQQDVVRWFSSDQWGVSRRMYSIKGIVTLNVLLPCPHLFPLAGMQTWH